MKDMLDKILQIEKKYNELGVTLSDPAVIQDYNKFRDLSKQRKSMEETVELYYAWKKAVDAIEEAKEMGAMALFSDKYKDIVRVVQIGPSIELCGGPHVEHTGVLGHFKIKKEEASSAGVRRIKAILE